MPTSPAHIRNLAIIAHIDHGKTTLIDSIFRAAHTFRENARVEERVMDSNDLERERGITIRSKHCTVDWNGYRINLVAPPVTPTSPGRWSGYSPWWIPSSCWWTPMRAPCPRPATCSPEPCAWATGLL